MGENPNQSCMCNALLKGGERVLSSSLKKKLESLIQINANNKIGGGKFVVSRCDEGVWARVTDSNQKWCTWGTGSVQKQLVFHLDSSQFPLPQRVPARVRESSDIWRVSWHKNTVTVQKVSNISCIAAKKKKKKSQNGLDVSCWRSVFCVLFF